MEHRTIKYFTVLIVLSLAGVLPGKSQSMEELMAQLSKPDTIVATATFKSTRIINGHSIERMQKNQLDVRISHRFGEISSGAYEAFGIDQSVIHLSLEYGVTDWLMIGTGRSSFEKTNDAFVKLSILRQTSGARNIPVHLSYLLSGEIYGLKWNATESGNNIVNRLSYLHQLLVARKFSENFSLQVAPTFLHRNYVFTALDPNQLYALGAGARYKLSKRVSVNAEYYWVYQLNRKYLDISYYNPLSIGIDLETGGHVFQIMLTNSQGMREGAFIGKTTGNWLDGDIHLGFNISRVFSL